MKKGEIRKGGTYQAKVSGRLTTVRVDEVEERDGFRTADSQFGRGRRVPAATRYVVTNLATGRTTVFRSAAKFRKEVG